MQCKWQCVCICKDYVNVVIGITENALTFFLHNAAPDGLHYVTFFQIVIKIQNIITNLTSLYLLNSKKNLSRRAAEETRKIVLSS